MQVTQISTSSHHADLFHLQKTVNKELRKVRKWLESKRLALNIDKMNFVIFHSPGKKFSDEITLKIDFIFVFRKSKPVTQSHFHSINFFLLHFHFYWFSFHLP